MSAVYIEHRPHATSENVSNSHYVIIVDGKEVFMGTLVLKKQPKKRHVMKDTDLYMYQGNVVYKIVKILHIGE